MIEGSRFNRDAFSGHAHDIASRFERRRGEFLKKLKVRSAIAVLLLLTFPLWYSLLTSMDDNSQSSLSAFAWVIIHGIAGAVIVGLIIVFAVLPLFRYRHYTVQIGSQLPGVDGMVQQHVSLKGKIFSELFSFFGDFTLHNDRKPLLRSFRDAPGMPEFDDYISEDYIRGAMDGTSVEIAEVQLLARRDHSTLPIFKGLFILLDINNTNLVLRGKFSGKTVLIADRKRENDYVTAKYSGYNPIALPDGNFERHFEAFSTDKEEASRLLSTDLLNAILKLSETVRHVKNQVWHADDRVAYAISAMAQGGSDIIAVAGSALVQWFRTGSFRTNSQRHNVPLHESQVGPDARAFNEYVHCAFYEDKVLISIPYQHDLFEPDSIFHPPLREDDITLTYNLMSTVGGIAGAVVKGLPGPL